MTIREELRFHPSQVICQLIWTDDRTVIMEGTREQLELEMERPHAWPEKCIIVPKCVK